MTTNDTPEFFDPNEREHDCDGVIRTSHTWELLDGQGIYICRVCERCEEAKKSRYAPWVFTRYDSTDTDDPIDE